MKKKSKLELPEDHLATVAKDGSRIALYPELVIGPWRVKRTYVQSLLIGIFLLTPWLTFNGTQLVLMDVVHGKLSLFGLTFWAHDGPMIFLILMTGVLTLALATAWWGRVWCGWICPQTVFIEGVFRRIEAFIEGNHIQRRALNEGPLNKDMILKKISKWTLFISISLILSHSFLAYFVGAENLLQMIQGNPKDNWVAFLVILFVTSVLLFDFSIFREQFCVLVCPYGRLQSVLLDSESLAVTYDFDRGEPRKGTEGATEKRGDCVNCFKCVTVCPTGVDIRRGQQMECIHCTACIDACDQIMDKVGSERGLIRYMSESESRGKKRGYLRTRPLVYLGLLLVCLGSLGISVFGRSVFHTTIVRAQGAPFKEISNETEKVLNHFKVHIRNQSNFKRNVFLKMAPTKTSETSSPNTPDIELVIPQNPIPLNPGQIQRLHFFLKFDKQITAKNGQSRVELILTDDLDHLEKFEFSILGPTVSDPPETK